MKIIHVSDLHLAVPGVLLFGSDPLERLEDCIADLNRHHADADLVVFSGDLANDGEMAAYAALADRLKALIAPYRLILGNHDDRAAFRSFFPAGLDADGFAQSALDIDGWRLVLADTLEPGHVEGRLCEERLAWLDGALRDAANVLLFLHHPPVALGLEASDRSRLADAEALLAMLRRHGNVRHIFAGHVHRLAYGTWHGIPFATLRGTNQQSALAFTGPHRVSFEAPTYAVILIRDGVLAIHPHEFPIRPIDPA